jgi:hypothetical protein
VAVCRTDDLGGTADPPVALTEGIQSAFAAAIVFPALGLLVALPLLGNLRASTPLTAQPAAAPVD